MDRYLAEVLFKDGTKSFHFDGEEIKFTEVDGEMGNTVRLDVPTSHRYDTLEWEHDMINGILDIMEGTNWSEVKEFIYL